MGHSLSSNKLTLALIVAAVTAAFVLGMAAFIFWPFFQDYDIERANRSFGKIESNNNAVDELKDISRLHGHVHASNSLHYYGTAYKVLLQNPEPFIVLAERGNAQEKQFIAMVLSDGKKSCVEWYGVEGSGELNRANAVLTKLTSSGATNTAILDAFRKAIAVEYP